MELRRGPLLTQLGATSRNSVGVLLAIAQVYRIVARIPRSRRFATFSWTDTLPAEMAQDTYPLD